MAIKKVDEMARYLKADTIVKQRLIAASFGEVGTLKTSFWASAPGPILFQSTDNGLEGVIDIALPDGRPAYQDQKEIYIATYDANTDGLDQDAAIETRDRFIEDFEHAIGRVRTIVWDKETQVYEIFRYAEFGAPSDNPSNYYPLYQKYRRLINRAKASDINLGFIQGMKTPWVPKVNKRTGAAGAARSDGERVRRGMPEIEELVHINVEHVHSREEGFMLNIGKSRGPGGREIQNTSIPYVEFPDFATLVFPDTDASDWE